MAPLDHTEVDGHSQYRYEHQTQYHRHSSELQDGQNSAYSHQNHHQTRQADQQQRSQLFQHTNTDQNNAGPTNHPMLDITFMDKKYIDQYEKARNRWVCATMEEWCGGAEGIHLVHYMRYCAEELRLDLTNTYGILLDFVSQHLFNESHIAETCMLQVKDHMVFVPFWLTSIAHVDFSSEQEQDQRVCCRSGCQQAAPCCTF